MADEIKAPNDRPIESGGWKPPPLDSVESNAPRAHVPRSLFGLLKAPIIAIVCLAVALFITANWQEFTKRSKTPALSPPVLADGDSSYAFGLAFQESLGPSKILVDPPAFAAGFSDGLAGRRHMSTGEFLELPTPGPTPMDYKASYKLGLRAGVENLTALMHKIEVDRNQVIAGIQDAAAGKPRVSGEQMKQTLEDFAKKINTMNTEDGETFLTQNKRQAGVKTTASGLQYNVLRQGDGRQPGPADGVTTRATWTLLDGTEIAGIFREYGQEPRTFQVSEMQEAGLREGIQLMKAGSRYRFFIPRSLSQPSPGLMLPDVNAVKIVDLELLDVNSAGSMQSPQNVAALEQRIRRKLEERSGVTVGEPSSQASTDTPGASSPQTKKLFAGTWEGTIYMFLNGQMQQGSQPDQIRITVNENETVVSTSASYETGWIRNGPRTLILPNRHSLGNATFQSDPGADPNAAVHSLTVHDDGKTATYLTNLNLRGNGDFWRGILHKKD